MSFMWNWATSVLSYFGLGELTAKDATVLFLGLDNAGKTTLLKVLKSNELTTSAPTQYATNETLMINNIKFEAYDLGGHYAARTLWKDYCVKVDAIVYLVDCADSERFEESRQELNALLQTTELKDVPFVIFGNKIDLKRATSKEEFKRHMGLTHTSGYSNGNNNSSDVRQIEVFMISVVKRIGISDGFKWLSKRIE